MPIGAIDQDVSDGGKELFVIHPGDFVGLEGHFLAERRYFDVFIEDKFFGLSHGFGGVGSKCAGSFAIRVDFTCDSGDEEFIFTVFLEASPGGFAFDFPGGATLFVVGFQGERSGFDDPAGAVGSFWFRCNWDGGSVGVFRSWSRAGDEAECEDDQGASGNGFDGVLRANCPLC